MKEISQVRDVIGPSSCVAMTTSLFLCQFELDLLAQRGELLMTSGHLGFSSVFRASNLRGALQLLDELRQAPISYLPQKHTPDARGYSESSCPTSNLSFL